MLVVVLCLVAGCSAVADAPAASEPCGQVYSAARCLAMVDEAASRTARTRDDVTAIEIVDLPKPPPGVIRTGSGFDVRLTFIDGTSSQTSMCGGVDHGPACTDTQLLRAASSIVDAGYHDVPCPDGAPPHSCGTPLPTLEAAAEVAAHPLSVARRVIPIDHLGSYEIPLGEAALANGIATSASFAFVEAWPLDVSLRDGVGQITLRSLEPDGKPFQNYYDHGWRPGVERVEAVLTFEVLWFEPGAVLAIRDIGVY